MYGRIFLFADAGGTNVKWVGLNGAGTVVFRFETPGINAMLVGSSDVERRLSEVAERLGAADVAEIRYYGAGCATESIKLEMAISLKRVFGADGVAVESDLLGAAIGMCGDDIGVVCILGTGSNSCYYDGRRVAYNVSPLGFILGDEGSGAVLGRRLLGDVLKGQLPSEICDAFYDRYGLDGSEIVRRVYRGEAPSRFLASFAPFLKDNMQCCEIRHLVESEFERFFVRNVSHYAVYGDLPVNFCGSIAWNFSESLAVAAESTGFRLGRICASPMDGLVEYFSRRLRDGRIDIN